MKTLLLIGIGAGDPDQITIQAIKAMNRVDVFFMIDKGDSKRDLLRMRQEMCERHVTNRSFRIVEMPDPERDRAATEYRNAVDAWHDQRAASYRRLLDEELDEGCVGAFLVWGDPSLYDSTLRVVERLAASDTASFDYEVIPGITSIQALAAKHRVTITQIAGSTLITTGRNLAAAFPERIDDTVVVLLDGNCSFGAIPFDDLDIYWGANLGTESEALVSGRVVEVANAIKDARRQVTVKAGWVMDTYLLKKTTPSR